MVDLEVLRMRALRSEALRLRCVARALARRHPESCAVIAERAACAGWRIARVATGRLRSHPYLRFQRDASYVVLVANATAALLARILAATPRQASVRLMQHIGAMERKLSYVRAFTSTSELSEFLGRSQAELQGLRSSLIRGDVAPLLPARLAGPAGLGIVNTATDSDWPFLAL